MPQTFHIPDTEPELFIVTKNGVEQFALVLDKRPSENYVHYYNTDKRLDEWIPESIVRPAGPDERPEPDPNASRKRKRGSADPDVRGARSVSEDRSSSMREGSGGGGGGGGGWAGGTATPGESSASGAGGGGVTITEEEYDIEHHKQITAKRNFDKVTFGKWQIKTWYFSPYPLIESEADDPSTPSASGQGPSARIPGVARTTLRSHGRTSDLFAGGLGRSYGSGERSTLWVCDRCFKYMAEGISWEMHVKKCTRRHPPGRKVYQRGAHIIWEVDGAKEKLYCQNLSLFGKLFIDIKTLFFDCDNFLFYILTDADSQRDHVLGFFSKEKISYDDYNLACIVVLPPYQKKGYGMLMIEFSYELSRRAGKIGTPERPLSDLGLRSYLTYWISTLIRFFRRLLSVLPTDAPRLITVGTNPFSPHPNSASSGGGVGGAGSGNGNGGSGSASGVHTANGTTDLSQEGFLSSPSPSRWDDDGSGGGSGGNNGNGSNGVATRMRRRKSIKGWDGEVESTELVGKMTQFSEESDMIFTSLRVITTTANPDGSATSHVSVRCTLVDIARVTGLRVEDAAFALNECGLLTRRHVPVVNRSQSRSGATEGGGEDGAGSEERLREEMTVLISREIVEAVAKERNVKKMCMDLAHVLL